MYIKTLSLIAVVSFCAACSSPDDPIDDTDTGQVESDAATDTGDVAPGPGDDASHADAGAAADGDDAELAAAVSRYATALCERGCTSPFVSDLLYGNDVATCTAQIIALTYWHKEDGATTRAADFDACAAAASTTSCDDSLPDECDFTGSLAVGESCSHPSLCDTGLCDFSEMGATCGVCVEADSEGDPCREFTHEGNTLWWYCVGDVACGADKTCYATAAIGESCGPRPCEFGDECINGQCVAQGAAGDPCDSSDSLLPQCFGSGGFVCNETAGECVDVELRDVGETCGDSFSDGLACRTSVCLTDPSDPNTRTCQARGSEGATCDDIIQDCEMGLVCNGGVCGTASCTL